MIALGHSGRSACRVAGVHRSTFLRQRRQPLSDRGVRRIVVADEISRIHARSRGSYGKRRIKAALLAECEMIVNHKLVASIMSELGLHGMPRRRRRGHPLLRVPTPADLVNRAFTATRPNELWCTDITEHSARDGKVYCCAVLDCFSKKIVGRSFSTVADTALVNNAINMAVAERSTNTGLIVHADHGTQFTSWSFGEICADIDCCLPSVPWAIVSITRRWNLSGAGCKPNFSTRKSGRQVSS
ncbi:IS3 family transposase [Nocardia takedensis]